MMVAMATIIGGFDRSCLFAMIFEIAGRPRKEDRDMSARKRKRLNRDDRSNLVGYLAMGMTVPEIAERMSWSPSTIYREIVRCPQAKEGESDRKCRLRPGKYYVCNQCPKHASCKLDKVYYNSKAADSDADGKKRMSHAGPRVSLSVLSTIDRIVADGTAKGQSLEYIHHFNAELHCVSCVTIRRWVSNGYLTTKRGQLRRARRYSKKYAYHRPNDGTPDVLKAGRTYSDFLEHTDGRDDFVLLELDSVEGTKKARKRIFTLMFVKQGFQIARLYDVSAAASSVLREAEDVLSCVLGQCDSEIILLSDNGLEFASLPLVERLSDRIRVFYTNPYKSTDKAHCERNHEHFRYVCPKGNQFDDWTQETVNEIFSNVNSYAREDLEWKSPYALFVGAYSEEAAKALGMREISPTEVNLATKF